MLEEITALKRNYESAQETLRILNKEKDILMEEKNA